MVDGLGALIGLGEVITMGKRLIVSKMMAWVIEYGCLLVVTPDHVMLAHVICFCLLFLFIVFNNVILSFISLSLVS